MAVDSIARTAIRAVFTGTGTQPEVVTRAVTLMGGRASFALVGASADLMDDVVDHANRLERLWSRFLPDSDVSRLNAAEGAPVAIDPLTVRLIAAMLDGARLTGGDYDATLLPDVLAAGYRASALDARRVTVLPASAVSPGNLSGLTIEDGAPHLDRTVTLPLGTTIDPGGVGKGLAADLLCAFALEAGAWGALAELGGDIVVAGQAPDTVAWRLGVENPFAPAEHSAVVRLAAGALVTSSQRKRRFPIAASTPADAADSAAPPTRHHLVDPRTHDSAATRVQTVSVIAATGARAEVLAKPGFLRPTADYLAWLPTVGAAGLIIDDTGLVSTSTNWEHYA
ncbi:FAD:protein FMN transferase [Cryobacterium sp. 5B3]|uniref:FAD:protein FMN transferase n=2 Tax=unclassified Cryobacterium TaxID=2649013 RepID=UPI002AB4AD56|nr:FAD:protein FMN transferase [Cryobacterium sp. 5B3]MDY7542549.1 FAD:protein FMN transferase [Cryobacterium sp. 5B3]MEB0275172.1 FAD:protein FMN transferase [Cryobacterium sp. 5B3]